MIWNDSHENIYQAIFFRIELKILFSAASVIFLYETGPMQ